jgi:acyl-CoA synthetase (AMP-forming)/AMP-acid ligase II
MTDDGLLDWTDARGRRLRLSPMLVERRMADGEWSGVTIGERLDQLAQATPDKVVAIDGAARLTAGALRRRALRLAAWLGQRGVQPGEVVSFQLPNWHEAMIVGFACAYGGFVVQPLVPIFREAELGFMLADAGSRALFVPGQFGKTDHMALAQRVRGAVPSLAAIVGVRDDRGDAAFEAVAADGPAPEPAYPDANAVKLILYTSGTTSAPKGVMHTHNTLDCELRTYSAYLQMGPEDVVFMPSTVGHITGYLYGLELPILLGCPTVLMDAWDARRAADLIEEHGVTYTVGATTFIQELAQVCLETGRTLPSLRHFPTGGAPVPPVVIELAERAFARCQPFRIYGSTEAPTVTLGDLRPGSLRARADTDGVPVGNEVRIVGGDGAPLAAGEEGEIVVRGPELCVGYLRWDDNAAFDADGFFHTGDLGRLRGDGALEITGRKKDIIIRGGENISPREVEDAISELPQVQEIAVVAMPHPRLGETGCAVAVLTAGASLELADITRHLEAKGLAKPKWPERLVVLAEMPHTPAGKIIKTRLREMVAELA